MDQTIIYHIGLFQKVVPPLLGVERKKQWKIPGGGESFDGIQEGYSF